jgi:putative FmdB family regulatory protein
MPTYEYFCTKCEHSFEAVQSMKDPHFDICPEGLCQVSPWGKGCVKRQLGTGAGLIFKGSGFYITDYRSDSYKADAKKDAPASASAAPSSSGGEGKPAEGAKPKSDLPAAAPAKSETPKPSSPPPKPASD